MTDKVKRLFLDLELSPTLFYGWPQTGKTHTSYDQILEDSKIIMIGYKWEHSKTTELLHWDLRNQDDSKMVEKFQTIAAEADVCIGHNSRSFDIRHIATRLCDHNLKPIHIENAEDTYKDVKKKLALPSYKLDYLVKRFGLGAKMALSGWNSWIDVCWNKNEKEFEKMKKYCKMDVILSEKLYHRLYKYIDHKVNYGVFTDGRLACPDCSSTKVYKAKDRLTRTGMRQQWQCQKCARYWTTGKNLIKKASERLR